VSSRNIKYITVHEFLRYAKRKYGLTKDSDISRLFNISRQAIFHWKKTNKVPVKYLTMMEQDIVKIKKYQTSTESQLPDDAIIMKKEKGLIPVVGLAQAGPGIISEDDYPVGSGDEYLSRPHGLRDSQAFGVVVVDDSMRPAFRHHQRIICSPNIEAQTGDRCVIGLKTGERLIAKVRFDGDKIQLKKYNDTDIHVNKIDVEFVYKIVWSKEL